MRGETTKQATMLMGVTTDELVPADHLIRHIRGIVESVLRELSPRFEGMYAKQGRPSVPPEHLLKATLLMALYSIRSERRFCERLQYDLLFKWFLGLNISDRAFPPTTFTLGADKGYDTKGFVEACREREVTPHVAQNTSRRRSAIDGRTTHHPGYAQSLRKRKRVEEIFGWMKTVAGGRKLRYIGLKKNQMWATFTAAAYNLVRMANIDAANA